MFVQRVYFFLVVMIGWVFFRSPNLTFAVEYLLDLAGLRKPAQALPFARTIPLPVIDPSIWLVMIVAALLLLPWGEWLRGLQERTAQRAGFYPVEIGNLLLNVALLLLSLSAIASTIQSISIYAMF